jgi:mRNA-degrading endonuclease toxin of MazEF toxin-antitoxin module
VPEPIAWLLVATAALALAVALTAVRNRRRRAAPPPRPSTKKTAGTKTPSKPATRPPQARPPIKAKAPTTRAPATRATTTRAPAKRPQTATKLPAASEIWWADVPFHGEEGSKVRPCLVLRRAGTDAIVLKITSQDQSDRDDHIRIPTHAWDHGADHDSYLDLSDPYTVPVADFERRAGQIDTASWKVVRAHHDVDQPPRP